MKIIHWNDSKKSHPITGIGRYEDELFNAIRALGRDFEIERIQRVENRVAGSVPVSWLLRYRRKQAVIVHATAPVIAPVVYFRRPKSFVVTVHDLSPLIDPSVITDSSMKLQWMLVPNALKKVDRIIAVSEFTKKEVVRLAGVGESMIDVVHEAVDGSKYYPMDKSKCKERLGFGTNDKHILVVASNLRRKRMDLTKEVFEEVRKRRVDVKLVKAGYAEALSGDHIINTGWIPEGEMPILYNCADVLLCTSEYEGFCLPILEAMSCGVPVVSSNKASIPEIIGSYGTMVDLDSDNIVEQFTEKILSCIDKGKDEKAIEQSRNFSWEKAAKETLKVYEEAYYGD